jgi:hypothetical protein
MTIAIGGSPVSTLMSLLSGTAATPQTNATTSSATTASASSTDSASSTTGAVKGGHHHHHHGGGGASFGDLLSAITGQSTTGTTAS